MTFVFLPAQSAFADMPYIGWDHPIKSMTGVTGQLYTHGAAPYPHYPAASDGHVRSIYLWHDSNDYLETGVCFGNFPTNDVTEPWVFTAYEKEGVAGQVQSFPQKASRNTWYNFQIYSDPRGSRTWRLGKNNTVHRWVTANFSAGQPLSSAEFRDLDAYDLGSFDALNTRYASGTSFELWTQYVLTDAVEGRQRRHDCIARHRRRPDAGNHPAGRAARSQGLAPGELHP
jgi:hypothetical protein